MVGEDSYLGGDSVEAVADDAIEMGSTGEAVDSLREADSEDGTGDIERGTVGEDSYLGGDSVEVVVDDAIEMGSTSEAVDLLREADSEDGTGW
ncbi:hypothetical protein Droror1_Dr00026551 [Drosera rotundifolia]